MSSVRSNNSSNNVFDAPIPISPGDKAIETQQTQETDFSFDLWRETFKAVVQNEKKALETWETIAFELEVTQRGAHGASSCIIKLDLVCEPGKPARLLSCPTAAPFSPVQTHGRGLKTLSAKEAALKTFAATR